MAVLSGSRLTRAGDAPLARPSRGVPSAPVALASAGALFAACLLSPSDAPHGPVVCPFRLVTGLPCPGCGLTRAWVFLAHGRVGDAVSANPFALVTLPAAVVLLAAVMVALVRRRPLPDLGGTLRHPATIGLVAAFVAFGIVRAVAVATGHASA